MAADAKKGLGNGYLLSYALSLALLPHLLIHVNGACSDRECAGKGNAREPLGRTQASHARTPPSGDFENLRARKVRGWIEEIANLPVAAYANGLRIIAPRHCPGKDAGSSER